jgi:hypothetical protein
VGGRGFCLGAGKTRSQPVLGDRPGKNACLHRAASTGENAADWAREQSDATIAHPST